jgi:hypothetical protein
MNSEDLGFWAGWIGGIAASLIGVLGGAYGTYMSLKHTNTPRERAFMIRCSLVVWFLVIAFVVGLMLLPVPYNILLWIPYLVVLVVGVQWMNKRQAQIRAEGEKP